MEIDNLESRGRSREVDPQPPRRCYNCQGIGHIARQCPSPRLTSGRGRRTTPRPARHRVNTLEAESGKEEAPVDQSRAAESNQLNTGRNPDLLQLRIAINGHCTLALVDCGANENFMDGSFAR